MQAVLLPVGRDLYALPIEWVRQVLSAPQVTALVTAPRLVLGLFNMRGEIVPLLDTAALLGIGATDIDAVTFVVVLGGSVGPVALAATALPERVSLTGPASVSALPGTTGTFGSAGRVVVLLDPAALVVSAGLSTPDEHPDARAATVA